jgi:hypothetical protein
MRLVWYQRADDLWNAACACNATLCGVTFEQRAAAESRHFELAAVEREHRASRPDRFEGNQIAACGPKLPEPNPNLPDPFVFP